MALTIDGSDPTGDLGDLLDAKLPIAGGKILQIVRATDATSRTTTSTSFVDVTGMSVTITPQKSNSAVLLVCIFNAVILSASGIIYFRLADSSNNAISGANDMRFGSTSADTKGSSQTLIGYATPATTSATTYKLRFMSETGATVTVANNQNTGQLYAIEVSA